MIIKVPDVDPILEWRKTASLTKSEFIIACVGAGILTKEEAASVGRGDWPSAMGDFLALLDDNQAIEAQIEWAAQDDIRRMNVFVLSLGSWLGMSDTQIDALFGWSG